MGHLPAVHGPPTLRPLLFFLLLVFGSFYLFFSSYMHTFSFYLMYSWQVKERSFKIDQIATTDFSWMIGLKWIIFCHLCFLIKWLYNDFASRKKQQHFLSGTLFEMFLVLGINYKSTLGFTEYITPKNQSSFP